MDRSKEAFTIQSTPINISSRREVFWDDYLIEQATVTLRQHSPQDKGIAMICDAPWEGNGCMYPVILRHEDTLRLYYKACNTIDKATGQYNAHPESFACCAVSQDGGRSFAKPDYGICQFDDNARNNIILARGGSTKNTDNFAVFADTNPACPQEERYKAVADNGPISNNKRERILCSYMSPDGIHFSYGGEIHRGGMFDSMNCAFWDRHTQHYFLYMRDWHEGYPRYRSKDGVKKRMRALRYSISRDFTHWTQPQPVDFNAPNDIELYTNGIQPYYRADHMFLGLATRYVERLIWSPSYDYLPNPDHRRIRFDHNPREGLAITDCVLITSRNGVQFHRWDEAFISPGIERRYNWVYGDCYCSWGMVETAPGNQDGAPDELSLFAFENHQQANSILRRYAVRKDGFISVHAPLEPGLLLTRPLIFDGHQLTMNFSTSAIGFVKVDILDQEGHILSGFEGYEMFGDSLNRPVVFASGTNVSSLAGKPVRLHIRMSDADLYSMKFGW
ncbi:MAG: hypothetical protein SCM11_12905 [Bacillota bacterium]|nr:hypothetical protein [Bacillota bacterium]